MTSKWGPLAGLIGDWEGEGGVDRAFSHSRHQVVDTPYRETCSMRPFGPGDNGRQILYGLDYRTGMWRGDEEDPFHMEVGYWLWDAATGEVLKGFVVPRGITALAGGIADQDATSFTLRASLDDPSYSIAQNHYLAAHASSLSYEVTITIAEDEWTYEQTTMLRMDEFTEPFAHTDHHGLHRVALS